MTVTATETYPEAIDFALYGRMMTELRAAGSRETAASITGAISDWAGDTAEILRGMRPQDEEHLDSCAWSDTSTWLRLIAEALKGEMKAAEPPGRQWWLSVPENEWRPWQDLADADGRREWAAAWSVLRPSLEDSTVRPFTRQQVTTVARAVIDAPW